MIVEVMLLKLWGGFKWERVSSFWKCGEAYRYGGVHPERRLSVLVFAWAWHHERGENLCFEFVEISAFSV